MGTNYYLKLDPCQHCGRASEEWHIGKSSAGWCFSLHVIPERDINSLDDWQREWSKPGRVIADEYGQVVTTDEMLEWITDRSWERCYWTKQQYVENYAIPGPKNLVRHRMDGSHCIGHGAGTWDLITGEFS